MGEPTNVDRALAALQAQSLTPHQADVLETAIDYRDRLGWALTTTRSAPLRTVRKLCGRRLLKKLDERVVLINPETGFSYENERWRDGYDPTTDGRLVYAAWMEMRRAEMRAAEQASQDGGDRR